MTTLPPTLHERSDRASILSNILEVGDPRPGVTLIAVLDLRSGSVLHVRHLETPEPLPEDACDVPSELSALMSPTLRSLAHELVPERDWIEGAGWGVPDQELVTVVCRWGERAVSAAEEQFFWGWRYSNHLTAAFHGDVYVVTPTGWAGLDAEGTWPALQPLSQEPANDLIRFPALAERRGLLVDPAVQEAASVLAAAALNQMGPHRGECLLCYESRLLAVLGCDRSFRIAQRFRDVSAPRATAMETRLRRWGGSCDCQVLELHGIRTSVVDLELALDQVVPDAPRRGRALLFGCFGVRPGSTQPCCAWMRLA